MKKNISAFLSIVIIVLLCVPLSGCADNNFEFLTKDEFIETYGDGQFENFAETIKEIEADDALICIIRKESSGSGSIPAEHNGKKVFAVFQMDNDTAFKLESDIPEGIECIAHCQLDSDRDEITFPASLHTLHGVFLEKDSASEAKKKLVFEGSITHMEFCFNDEPSKNELNNINQVIIKGDLDLMENSFKDSETLTSFEVDGEFKKMTDSLTNQTKLESALNSALKERLKTESSSTDSSVPDNPRFVFCNAATDNYEYPYSYNVFSPYAATSPEQVNLVLLYEYSEAEDSNYVWVKPKSSGKNEYVKDAKKRELTITLYRFDNNEVIKSVTSSVTVPYNEDDTKIPERLSASNADSIAEYDIPEWLKK